MCTFIMHHPEDNVNEASGLQLAAGMYCTTRSHDFFPIGPRDVHFLNVQLSIRDAWANRDLGRAYRQNFTLICQVSKFKELRKWALATGVFVATCFPK